MSGATVQLDQQVIDVVTHIADVSQPEPTALPRTCRQTVGPLDIAQVPELQWRLRTLSDVSQQIQQELPLGVTAALLQGNEQGCGRGSAALDRSRD